MYLWTNKRTKLSYLVVAIDVTLTFSPYSLSLSLSLSLTLVQNIFFLGKTNFNIEIVHQKKTQQ